jgi:hypothetical protein
MNSSLLRFYRPEIRERTNRTRGLALIRQTRTRLEWEMNRVEKLGYLQGHRDGKNTRYTIRLLTYYL